MMHGIAMPTQLFPKLLERAVDQHGLLTPDDARAVGTTENALRRLAHEGVIARVGFAVYQVPQLAGDPLAQYQEALLWLRAPAALTHDTALDLHHLCDINPGKVHVTVDVRNRPRRTAPTWIQIHFGALPDADLTWLEGLRIATPTRAILDAIATNIGQQFIEQAIETGKQRGLLTQHDLRRIEIAQLRQRLQILERLDQGA
jgi:predicted transcriptional regulator of viral defense system